jgi:putative transposase
MSKLIPKAYKYRFYPQDDLKVILAKTFGCVRFVYNKTLDFSEKHYAQKEVLESKVLEYKNLTGIDRVKFVTELKNTLEEDKDNPNYGKLKYPWLHEVTSIALQQSARHLNNAYDRFFQGQLVNPSLNLKEIIIILLPLQGKILSIFIKILINQAQKVFINSISLNIINL